MRRHIFSQRAPWPASILIIGDSFGNNGAIWDWALAFKGMCPGVAVDNQAEGSKCLWDVSGVLGTNTILASIDDDLAANPGADLVVWTTSCLNDIVGRKTGRNSVVLGNLVESATYVLNAIETAQKGCIVLAVPFIQALIGIISPDLENALAADIIRKDFNAWLQQECEKRGMVYYDMKWFYKYLGPNTAEGGNGIYPEYNTDFIHPNELGAQIMAEDIAGRIRAMRKRKRAAA